ncbi:MAG TPA: hypothetical protein PKA20_24150 [Burkholderiaceae bacterium]|nr:hypothetical protein [Burkholderiaceae bacterium]
MIHTLEKAAGVLAVAAVAALCASGPGARAHPDPTAATVTELAALTGALSSPEPFNPAVGNARGGGSDDLAPISEDPTPATPRNGCDRVREGQPVGLEPVCPQYLTSILA